MAYYKKKLSICGSIQIGCGLLAVIIFLVEWKVFGLLIPLYMIGIVHVFCGAWSIFEVYKRATITSGMFCMAIVVAVLSGIIAVVQLVFSIVEITQARIYVEYYRAMDSHLVENVDSIVTIDAFAVVFLILGASCLATAVGQIILCVRQCRLADSTYHIPVRYLTKERMGSSRMKLVEAEETPSEPVATIVI